VDAVASHGQTVRHLPQQSKFAGFDVHGTMQLGSLEQIASHTGKMVVGDFRQADIALGNEGAPITTSAMQRLFATPRESRLIVNIGGMANYYYFPASRSLLPMVAADCGPGNSLCDILAARLFGQPCDRGGKLATGGQISKRLLSLLLGEPFFKGTTLSTGREVFGQSLAERILGHGSRLGLSKYDVLATASALTSASIANSIRHFARRDKALGRLYLTGGGVHNRFFLRHLRALVNGLEVVTVASLGYDPDLVEAAAFAIMGEAALRGETLSTGFAGRGGNRRKAVLGRIVQPPQEG
jgi:anhydro-N-acetylmuramic acid kinase